MTNDKGSRPLDSLIQMLRTSVGWVIELIVPWIVYHKALRVLEEKIDNADQIGNAKHSVYSEYPVMKLRNVLKEEHDRASRLEQKTYQMIFIISIAVATLSVGGSLVVGAVYSLPAQIAIGAIVVVSIIYFLIAGMHVAQSLQAVRTYGLGMQVEIDLSRLNAFQQTSYLAGLLLRQELMNNIRSNQNAIVYICVRNGLFLLLISILVSAVVLLVEAI